MEDNPTSFFSMKEQIHRLFFLLIPFLVFSTGKLFAQVPDNNIRILYFNDAHELSPVKTEVGYIGGVSRMKTLIDSIKKKTPNTLVLFGGDLAGGTLGGKLFRGSVMVEALNTFPIDFANFGQHEFDYGLANANKLVSSSAFKWFTSNIKRDNGERIANTCTYIIREIGDFKIGIIGLTDKINTSKPTFGVKQTDIMQAAQKMLKKIENVDMIVAVTQMDMKLNEELLRKNPQIKLILTEETSQYKTETQFIGNSLIVAACGNMGQLIEVSLRKKNNIRLSVYNVDDKIKPNVQLEAYVKAKTLIAEQQLSQILITIESESGNNLTGNIIADAYKESYGTQIGIINGGGVRADFSNDKVTVKDVYSALPFENFIIPVRITGREVKAVIDSALQRLPPYVSGISYEIAQNNKGVNELKNVYFENRAIQDNEIYTVSMPDYIVLGGGNFSAIPETKWINPLKDCEVDASIVIDYLKKHPRLNIPTSNRVEWTKIID